MNNFDERRRRRAASSALCGLVCASALIASVGVSVGSLEAAEDNYTAPVAIPTEAQERAVAAAFPSKSEAEMLIDTETALLERAIKIEDVTVTHYDCCVKCCGKDDGITYTGVKATPYVTVAVDPDVIPLGSTVIVDYGDGELHYCRAEDIGGAIQGDRIDLCVTSHQEALELGVRNATVYWIEQEDAG